VLKKSASISVLILIFLSASVVQIYASPAAENIWYSLYFQSVHSGYTHVTSAPDIWKGRKAVREDSETVTKLTVLGFVVQQDITTHSWSDPITGQPLFQTFSIESGGSTTYVEATFTRAEISATLKSGAETTQKTIPIPTGEKIVSGSTEGISSKSLLKVGQTETDIAFDPISLSLDKQVSTVRAINIPVKDALDGKVHSTAKVFVADTEGNATAFQGADSTPILVLMPAGLVMIETDQSDALSPDSTQADYAVDPTATGSDDKAAYDPEPDLAVSSSVSPTGLKLTNERTLMSLTVKVNISGQSSRVITETAAPVPPLTSDPISNLSTPAMKDFLTSAPYLSVDDPSIKRVAAQVVGSETDSYKAVKLIHDWVYAQMSPVGTLGLPRSASDILSNPQGVCRDYAVLYTTLARAAGIPTKVNAGLVGYHGRFYYHAWASSYIGGEVGWLPVDPTLPTMFVDASHVALASGDATVMFTMGDVIGATKVETLNLQNSL
jgi:hypothetical protein